MSTNQYCVQQGPEGYLPPAAALMGVMLPEKGESLVEGKIVSEEEAMKKIAKKNPISQKSGLFPRSSDSLGMEGRSSRKSYGVKGISSFCRSQNNTHARLSAQISND